MQGPKTKRQKVRLSGDDSLRDVALRVFKDARLTPLFVELNPAHDASEALAKDTIIVLPTLDEARTFTKKHGFTLGHDPSKEGATRVRKSWKRHQEGNARKVEVDPEKLALLMGDQAFEPEVIAERFMAMLSPTALKAFIEKEHEDPAMQSVAKACESKLLQRDLILFLNAFKDILSQSKSANGQQRLLERIADNAAESKEVLSSLLLNAKLITDLVERAAYVVPFFSLAGEIASMADYDRESLIEAHDDSELLGALVLAKVDDVPFVSPERLKIMGLSRMFRAIDGHIAQLLGAIAKVEDTMERAPLNALRSVFSGEAVAAPSPWKLIRTLYNPLAPTLLRLHAGRREHGIASMINAGDGSAVKRMSAAELVARAAHNARIIDEHEGVAEHLAPLYAELFEALKPAAPDRGQEAQVRGRRRARFEKEMFTKRDDEGDALIIASVVDDVVSRVKRGRNSQLQSRASSLPKPQQKGAQALAQAMTGPLVVMLRGASNSTRALLIACALFDPELSEKITRETGRESTARTLKKHAARIVSLATSLYSTMHETEK